MKIHRPVVRVLSEALVIIFVEGKYADKVIERSFKANRKWGSRDRNFFAEAVYDIVRWWRRLHWALGLEGEFAAEKSSWYLAGWLTLRGHELPDFEDWSDFDQKSFMKRWESPPSRAIAESIPDWFDQLGEKELKDQWAETIHGMNFKAPVFLRTNFLKTNMSEAIEQLKSDGIEVEPAPEAEGALRMKGPRKNVFATEAFKKGYYEMQDLGSQQIAPFLKVEPGQRVVDACAGAGGKTLHLAALMKNKGRIIALDIHEWKLTELKRRSRRAGADVIETRPIVSSKVTKRLKESADRVLLDVPCSGSGVLRRNPDTKWKLSQNEINELNLTQKEILSSYSKITKPDGLLVYATCSVFSCENEQIVHSFLSENENSWVLEEEKNISPSELGSDGFYMARLRKLNPVSS